MVRMNLVLRDRLHSLAICHVDDITDTILPTGSRRKLDGLLKPGLSCSVDTHLYVLILHIFLPVFKHSFVCLTSSGVCKTQILSVLRMVDRNEQSTWTWGSPVLFYPYWMMVFCFCKYICKMIQVLKKTIIENHYYYVIYKTFTTQRAGFIVYSTYKRRNCAKVKKL